MADEPEKFEQSFIHIQFKEPGSVICIMKAEGVTPLQMMAAAEMLGIRGKNAYIQQENERAKQDAQTQLSVPKPGILVGKP